MKVWNQYNQIYQETFIDIWKKDGNVNILCKKVIKLKFEAWSIPNVESPNGYE
jgi:hypothetical protein